MITKDVVVLVGDGIEVDLNTLENLSVDSVEKIRELIEQDILFSGIETITNIVVIEKGKETYELYEEEKQPGVSFFHIVDNVNIHVRIS